VARKLSDRDVERLRELWAQGWNAIDLASEFNISRQHVGRIVREEQHQPVAALDSEALRSGVAAAVDVFLTDVELGRGDEVLAADARVLAAALDRCAARETAAAAAAIPRLSSELVGVLDRLRAPAAQGPSKLDALVQRRAARRLAAAATNNGPRPH
jgi:AraC-like DNA-binding protein